MFCKAERWLINVCNKRHLYASAYSSSKAFLKEEKEGRYDWLLELAVVISIKLASLDIAPWTVVQHLYQQMKLDFCFPALARDPWPNICWVSFHSVSAFALQFPYSFSILWAVALHMITIHHTNTGKEVDLELHTGLTHSVQSAAPA